MKKLLTALLGFLVFSGLAYAQSNDYIDTILASEAIQGRQAIYLAALGGGLIEDTASEADALALAIEKKWPLANKPDSKVTLDVYSLLLMKAFGVSGGIAYTFVPIPRYALRELQYRKIVIGKPAPGKVITGEESLRMLGNMAAWKEAR